MFDDIFSRLYTKYRRVTCSQPSSHLSTARTALCIMRRAVKSATKAELAVMREDYRSLIIIIIETLQGAHCRHRT